MASGQAQALKLWGICDNLGCDMMIDIVTWHFDTGCSMSSCIFKMLGICQWPMGGRIAFGLAEICAKPHCSYAAWQRRSFVRNRLLWTVPRTLSALLECWRVSFWSRNTNGAERGWAISQLSTIFCVSGPSAKGRRSKPDSNSSPLPFSAENFQQLSVF